MSGKTMCLKVLLLGDLSVGKTCILNRLIHNHYSEYYRATIGSDFQCKHLSVDGMQVALQVWDPSGQERFRSITRSVYRGSDFCVVVFDVTEPRSFDNLDSWIEDFQSNCAVDESQFLILGNKIDCPKRKVSKAAVESWCGKRGLRYLEVSAKEALNIDRAFEMIAFQCIANEKDYEFVWEFPPVIRLSQEQNWNARGGCCVHPRRFEYEYLHKAVVN